MSSKIFVTRPYLPPLEEFLPMLETIWSSRILTNNGPYHIELEAGLADYLKVAHVSLVANGMLALSVAIEAADLAGEVITTPYSFVATSHAVKMGRLEPVFVDIRPDDLNIDADLIEQAITPRTSAILGVHVYGNPCAVDRIDAIAARHGLKVVYDAAHAFGVELNGRSLLSWGDLSTLSFHATKVFNTFEGGAIVSGTSETRQAVDRLRNFGIADEVRIPSVGGNAKMSEFNAALGVLQLKHVDETIRQRAAIDDAYRSLLAGIDGIQCLPRPAGVRQNHSYFPILVGPDYPISRDQLYEALKAEDVLSRRYFYPLLSNLPMYADYPSASRDRLPVANRVAEQVLCLPIYPGLETGDVERIVSLIRR